MRIAMLLLASLALAGGACKKDKDKDTKVEGSASGAPKRASDAHDKKGAHGGAIGICPVHVPEGAKTKSEKQAKGVKITITPKDKVDELKTDVDARITKASDWVTKNIKPGDKGNEG